MDEYHRKYYEQNKQKWLQYNRKHRSKDPHGYKAYLKKYRREHYEYLLKSQREKYYRNREEISKKIKLKRKMMRLLIIEKYGGKCACCNETEENFLSLDHINGNGNKHRKELSKTRGDGIYPWIIENRFPPEFQILCMNCNWGRYRNNGICPHKSH